MSRATPLAALLLAAAAGCAHVPGNDAGPEPAADPSAASTSVPAAPGAAPAGPKPEAAPPPAQPAAPPAPATSPRDARATADRLASIRAGVEAFLRAQGLVLWDLWTRGATPDLSPTLAAHRDLFTRETVLLVRQARDAASGDERRALSLLHAFLVGEFLGRAADAQGQALSPSLLWDGQAVATSRVPALLAVEASSARRVALGRAWAEAERGAAASATARWGAIATAARTIGYPSLMAAAADLRGESVAGLAALADRVLATSDAPYRALMTALARAELNQSWSDVRGRDLPRLLRSEDRRSLLPASHGAAATRATFAAIGMDLGALRGLVLDDEGRAGKDPRALAIPVEVPGDVRVSFVAPEGVSDVRSLLHELGAAVYFAGVRTPQVEFRRLGSVTPTTWADLFDDLVGDPAWLAERTGRDEALDAALVRTTAARRLHRARLLAAHLLDEIARSRPAGRNGSASRKVLERALLRPVDDDELQVFVTERDPLLQGADELRSILLASQASAFLSARAAGPWWRSGTTGPWLAATFAEGSRRSPMELARAMGRDAIDASALLEATRVRMKAAGVPFP